MTCTHLQVLRNHCVLLDDRLFLTLSLSVLIEVHTEAAKERNERVFSQLRDVELEMFCT